MTNNQEAQRSVEMDPVDIYSGRLKVISSGTVTSFEGKPIKIIFGPVGNRLILILTFVDETCENNKETKPRIEARNIGIDSFELILNNFTSSIGSYSINPIRIAAFSGLPVFFSFFVIGHSEGHSKTIHFTLYLEPPNLEAI